MMTPFRCRTEGSAVRPTPTFRAPSERRCVTTLAVSIAPASVSSTKPQIGSRMILTGRLTVAFTAAAVSFCRSARRMLFAVLAPAAFFAELFLAAVFFAAFLGLAAIDALLSSEAWFEAERRIRPRAEECQRITRRRRR